MHSQIVVNPRFHRGPKLATGDQFWQPKSVRGGPVLAGTDFFITVLLWRYYRRANAYINMAMGKNSSQH